MQRGWLTLAELKIAKMPQCSNSKNDKIEMYDESRKGESWIYTTQRQPYPTYDANPVQATGMTIYSKPE